MIEFIDYYFISPMRERTGFNPIQTGVYAIIAICAILGIEKLFKKMKVVVDSSLVQIVCMFIFFGSTVRVLVDAGIYPYEINGFYPLITPGIYLVISSITLFSILLFHKNRKNLAMLGSMLFLSQIALLVPLFQNFEIAAIIFLLALGATIFGYIFLYSLKNIHIFSIPTLAVFSHCLDGAATYIAIDFLGDNYFEQHFFVNSIFGMFNTMFTFLIVKIALSVIFVLMLLDIDNEQERNYYLLILLIAGLAPGFRDWLRILCGV